MKNIFVGNLDFAATESSIRGLFEPYGNIERVNLITDRDTGRSRGFAFVEMTDPAEADRAIAAMTRTEAMPSSTSAPVKGPPWRIAWAKPSTCRR